MFAELGSLVDFIAPAETIRHRAHSRTFLETPFLLPVAITYLAIVAWHHGIVFGPREPVLSGILLTTGVVTALALVRFGHAARHLRLITLGSCNTSRPS